MIKMDGRDRLMDGRDGPSHRSHSFDNKNQPRAKKSERSRVEWPELHVSCTLVLGAKRRMSRRMKC